VSISDGGASAAAAGGPTPRVRRALLLGAVGVALLCAVVWAGAAERVDLTDGRASTRAHAAIPRRSNSSATLPAALAVSAPRPARSWAVAARTHGRDAVWLARIGGVALLRFDQHFVHLVLHAGSSDGGTTGWRHGDRIGARESDGVIAAINGGFKLTAANVGFISAGHTAVPLTAGLASVVTYTNGSTDIGAWGRDVPSASVRVFSVLQNQRLLVAGGVPAATLAGCVLACWGGTVEGRSTVARSGLGVTASGELVWAAGEELSPAALAHALIAAGAVRAIELDINPWWVNGYLYLHRRGRPTPLPLVPHQHGITGALLTPYSRDFFTFVAG